MRFSLTYPEYRLLDIKALSEYHMACVATDLDFLSDQSLLSLNGMDLRAQEAEKFKRFCNYFFQISRLVDLELYWKVFHTIAHLGEGDHIIKTSNLVLNYSIDIDDFLSMFPKFAEIAYSDTGRMLCNILRTTDINRLQKCGTPLVDEVLALITELDSQEHNGVLGALGDANIRAELGDRSLSYLFRELFFCLRSVDTDNTDTEHELACAVMKDIQGYMKRSLINSYSKIWFDGETVLSIYSDLPSLRVGLVNKAKSVQRNANSTPITYELLRDDYAERVKRLTFSQDNNRTAVYEKYIAAQVIHSRQAHSMYNIQEQTSMIVPQSSDGKSYAVIDKPLNKTAAHKHDTVPVPTIEPGNLLADIYQLDMQTSKSKVRSKLEVLALPQLRGDFGCSQTALRKYPIMSRVGSAEPHWEYSHHSLFCGGSQGQAGLIWERPLPMYHCVNDILRPELKVKEDALDAVWSDICAKTGYRHTYSFTVNFADRQYLASISADASCRAMSINKVRPYIQYVMSGSFNANNWLFEAWRLQTLSISSDDSVLAKSFEEFEDKLQKLKVVEQTSPLSTDGIHKLAEYKKVVNEVYRLDAALREDGYSFTKFWYMYLADNFVHERSKNKAILNATEYIDNLMALPTGYHAMPSRYSATPFAAKNKDWVNIVTTDFGGLMQKLLNETTGRQATVFSVLRQQVSEVTQNIIAADATSSLGIMHTQEVESYLAEMYDIFRFDKGIISMPDYLLARQSRDTTIEHPDDVCLRTCFLQGLQFLVTLNLGMWSAEKVDIAQFTTNKSAAILQKSIESIAEGIGALLSAALTAEPTVDNQPSIRRWLRYPFLLLALYYTMTIGEFDEYRRLMARRGVADIRSGDPLLDYESRIGILTDSCRNLCLFAAFVLAGRWDIYERMQNKFIESIPCLVAALKALGGNFETVMHKIQYRFQEIDKIFCALSPEFAKCAWYINLVACSCKFANLQTKYMSDPVLISLENFGSFCTASLGRLDVTSCKTQTATVEDIDMLLSLSPSLAESAEAAKPEYEAVTYIDDFIKHRGALSKLIHKDNMDNLRDCPYYIFLLGKLIRIMFNTAEMRPRIHNIIQSKIYFETDFRPYAVTDIQSSSICTNIYRNLVYLLDNNPDDIAKLLAIPGGYDVLGSSNSVYSIAHYGMSSYDHNLFNFVQCITANESHAAGPIFIYHKPSLDRADVPYYLHVSGLYICGAAFSDEDISDVQLYCSGDDINTTQ